MAFDPWAIDCPVCKNRKLVPDSTAAAEIAGDEYQWCWYVCDSCGYESESEECINGNPEIWETVYKKHVLVK